MMKEISSCTLLRLRHFFQDEAHKLTVLIHVFIAQFSAPDCPALTFGLSSPEASLSFSDWELSPIRSEARTRPVL